VALSFERDRPVGYRTYGALLAVAVAILFGVRDNAARAAGDEGAADPLAQATAVMVGAALVLALNLARQRGALRRARRAVAPFASSASSPRWLRSRCSRRSTARA
jgi:hypothetical protein